MIGVGHVPEAEDAVLAELGEIDGEGFGDVEVAVPGHPELGHVAADGGGLAGGGGAGIDPGQ